ncbi:unnamed protein product [Cyprideis torosa]|uniref:Uncharacterized protein n=1 Tax=Cyprideis torosa TaxID=163714 RepID=A0A7R8WA21_9CRUS|nr:unnamed protein product [Cyprideis torosa]CAG0890421.1 unnamed protein product [Cyprideis torosa]
MLAAPRNPFGLEIVPNRFLGYGYHEYPDGSIYLGEWSSTGLKHGTGHLLLSNGVHYDGEFKEGLFSGLGSLRFPDGNKYEGEFLHGWFHGSGVFSRPDGMMFEGEFRGGRIWGHGLMTFVDGTNGFPRNEGFFQDCRLARPKRCPKAIQKAIKVASLARAYTYQKM